MWRRSAVSQRLTRNSPAAPSGDQAKRLVKKDLLVGQQKKQLWFEQDMINRRTDLVERELLVN